MKGRVREESRSGTAKARGPSRPDVFVSYSRHDEPFARRLDAALRERGKDVWVDWDDIPATADWRARIYAGIDAARAFVTILSPHLVASDVCREELAHAAQSNKRVIPVLRSPVDRQATPDELLVPNWIFFREGDDFDGAVGQLVEALEMDLEWLEEHARLLVRAVEWDREQRDASFLLRGRDLKEAETWLAEQGSHREAAAPLQAEFIVDSRKSASRRQNSILVAVVLALAITLVLAVVALIQRNDAIRQAKISRSRELAATSLARHQVDPQRSLLLALGALDASRTAEATAALRSWFLSPLRGVLRGEVNDGVDVGAISPDGKTVVASGADTAIVAQTATGATIATLRPVHDPTDAIFSPDGKLIVTTPWTDSATDGVAQIWQASTGKEIAILSGHQGLVRSAAFSEDDQLVVTAGAQGRVRVWRVATGKQVALLKSDDGAISDVSVSPDGKLIVTTSEDGTARVWTVASATQRTTLAGHIGRINEATFSPDGKLIVTAGEDGTARVWNATTGTQIAVLRGDAAPVNVADFSPDGKLIVTAGDDGTARLWTVATWSQRAALRGHGRPVAAIADNAGVRPVVSATFSPNGALIVTTGADHTARVWQTATGKQVAVINAHADTIVDAAFDGADNPLVVTGSADGTTRVWQPAIVRTLAVADYDGVFDAPVRAEFNSDSKLIITEDAEGRARLWESDNGKQLSLPHAKVPATNATISPNGRLMATVARGVARILDTGTGKQIAMLRTHNPPIVAAAFSPDSRLVVTTDSDSTLRVWQSTTGKLVGLLADQNDDIEGLVFSPDSTLIASLDFGNSMPIWRSDGGQPLTVIRSRGENNAFKIAAFSPDSQLIVTVALDGGSRVWTTATGQQVARLNTRGQEISDAKFSPDGQLLVTASSDGTARVWHTRTGKLVSILSGHDQFVLDAGFSPDGTLIVTAGEDGTTRIWQASNGEELAVLGNDQASVTQAAFSPDGTKIVTASNDGMARIYHCSACGSLRDVEAEAQRLSDTTSAEREAVLQNRDETASLDGG